MVYHELKTIKNVIKEVNKALDESREYCAKQGNHEGRKKKDSTWLF